MDMQNEYMQYIWYMVVKTSSFDPQKTDENKIIIFLLKLNSSLCEIRMGKVFKH